MEVAVTDGEVNRDCGGFGGDSGYNAVSWCGGAFVNPLFDDYCGAGCVLEDHVGASC